MNKGPEIFTSEDLNVEYSREERVALTRFPDGRGYRSKRRFSMRIMLLDLLLLCIIGGIIYPFILNRNSTATIQGVSCVLSARTDSEDVYISVQMKNSLSGLPQQPFDLEILIEGQSVKTISDITPPLGEERIIRFRSSSHEKKVSIRVYIRIKDETIEMNTVSTLDH